MHQDPLAVYCIWVSNLFSCQTLVCGRSAQPNIIAGLRQMYLKQQDHKRLTAMLFAAM